MQPVILYSSRSKMYRSIGTALAIGAAGVLVRMNGASTLALLCFAVSFFGICTVVRPLMVRGPRLTIDDKGIVDHMLRYGLIEWSDIEGASLRRKVIFGLFSNTFICLQLRNSKKYIDRLPSYVRPLVGLNRIAGGTAVTLILTGVEAEPEEILNVIDKELYARRPIVPPYASGGAPGRTTASH